MLPTLKVDPSIAHLVDQGAIQAAIKEHYADYEYSFEPFAQLDDAMDVVRVIVEDVPYAEHRLVEGLTVFARVDSKTTFEPVGFALKSLLTEEPRDIVDALTAKLDALAKSEQHEFVRSYISSLIPMAQHVTKSVRFTEGSLHAPC